MTKKINLNDSKLWQSLNWDEKEIHPNLKRTDGQVNIARANRIKADNKIWLDNITKANNDPEKKARRKASMPDQSGENNPFYNRTHSEKTKKNISEKKKGTPAHNKGTKHTDDALEKMRKPRSKKGVQNIRQGITNRDKNPKNFSDCTHCGMVKINNSNYTKAHGDACWLKGKIIVGYTKETVVLQSNNIVDLEKQGYNIPMIKDRIKVGERYQYKGMYWKLENISHNHH